MNQDLLERFRASTTEQLEQVLANPRDYVEEALEAARVILAERGVKVAPSMAPNESKEADKNPADGRWVREGLIVALFLSLLWIPLSGDLFEEAPRIVKILAKTLPTAVLGTLTMLFWTRKK